MKASPNPVQAITPQNAYVMAKLLEGVVNFGTGGKARVLGRPLGGKNRHHQRRKRRLVHRHDALPRHPPPT